MARCVAEQSIKYNGHMYEPGADLTGLPAKLVEEWIRTGYARKLTKLEPSVRDSKEEWAAFLAIEGYGEESELLGKSKDELITLFMEGPKEG
jgi:hypothetical protein